MGPVKRSIVQNQSPVAATCNFAVTTSEEPAVHCARFSSAHMSGIECSAIRIANPQVKPTTKTPISVLVSVVLVRKGAGISTLQCYHFFNGVVAFAQGTGLR